MGVDRVRIPCTFCGIPVRVKPGPRRVYCCGGCALADRLRAASQTGSGETAIRVVTLTLAFSLANQILCGLLALGFLLEGHISAFEAFALISTAGGALVWISGAWVLKTAGPLRRADAAGMLIALAILGLAGWRLAAGDFGGAARCAGAASLAIALWSIRPWFKKKIAQYFGGIS